MSPLDFSNDSGIYGEWHYPIIGEGSESISKLEEESEGLGALCD